jgi:hypothetical protein
MVPIKSMTECPFWSPFILFRAFRHFPATAPTNRNSVAVFGVVSVMHFARDAPLVWAKLVPFHHIILFRFSAVCCVALRSLSLSLEIDIHGHMCVDMRMCFRSANAHRLYVLYQ